MKGIKKIMSSRAAGIFCFLFAIANRIIFTSLYSLIGVDTKLQLVYAENILSGKGMGVTKYFTTNLDTPVFDTQQVFPPGFSFAIIPFLQLFGGNEYQAVFAYDIVVAVLFIVAVRILGKKIGLSPLLNNVFTLIAGCSQYFFFMSWSSTDAIGVCLLLFSLIAAIDVINNGGQIGLLKITGLAFLFCLPFFFRFMYLPVAFIIPLFILATGFYLNNKQLKTVGLKIILASILFILLYFITSSASSGNALYVTDVGRGFFPAQFKEWYPFLPASLINIDFGAQLIQTITGLDYSITVFLLKILNGLIFLFLIYVFWRYIIIQKRKLQLSKHFTFITLGSIVSIITLLLLGWLTLTYKELTWGYYKWTHVQDPRYFAFIYVFVPLVLFACLQHYRHLFKNVWVRLVTIIAFICLATEALHGTYYNGKILVRHRDLSYIRDADKGFRTFPELIKEIRKRYPAKELIVCSPDKFYLLTASQLGYKAIFDYSDFLQSDLKIPAHTVLLMPIQTRDVIIITDYIEKKKPTLFAIIGETSFYIQDSNTEIK